MKIKIICPRWPEGSLWRHFIFRFPYLSLTTLAALTPEDVEVTIEDENVQEINFQDQSDLVAVSIITPLANRGYAIADQFRKISIPVVIGGFHATWMAEEAGQHADAVALGEAEMIWLQVIEDFKKGSLQKFYKAEGRSDLQNLPIPRRNLLPKRAYFFTNTMQISRGCPFQCDFCSVTAFFGHTCRLRPLEEVRKEVELLQVELGIDDPFIIENGAAIYFPAKYTKFFIDDMRQEPQRIIGWKQRETDHISKDDQHKEVVQVSSFLLHYQDRLMDQQTIHDLPNHFPRAFQLRCEKRK